MKRLKYGAELNPSPLAARRLPQDAEVSFVPMEAVGEYGGLDLSRVKPLADVGSGYTYFADGDVVVAKITPCFENGKGALAANLTSGIAFGTTELHVLRALDAVDRRYLFYATLADSFRRLGEAEMYGAGGQKRVPEAFVENLKHPIPRESEQRAIAAFLDRETARIDALVAKKERLIELLQEQRTALITRAVTKGLDPTVPMKASGVEWLGEIPEGWAVSRADAFLHYDKAQVEPSSISGDLVFHYSIPSVQQTGDGTLEPPSEIDSAKLRIVGERLLVSKLNPRKGVVLIASEQEVPTVCSTEFVPFEGRGCELRWALYLFLAESTRQRLSAVVRSATRSHQRAEIAEIEKIWHGVPPVPEQRAIAAFLDGETARIDALIAQVRDAIERLKELRTALISAAVTGKIDVRDEATA